MIRRTLLTLVVVVFATGFLSAPALAAQVIGRQSQTVTSSHEVDASSQT